MKNRLLISVSYKDDDCEVKLVEKSTNHRQTVFLIWDLVEGLKISRIRMSGGFFGFPTAVQYGSNPSDVSLPWELLPAKARTMLLPKVYEVVAKAIKE